MSINNVTGFILRQSDSLDDTSWVKIIKNKNELARIELTCNLVYIRNEGNPVVQLNDNHSYHFYNYSPYGGIYGFPFFDVNNPKNNTNLPIYRSLPLDEQTELLYNGVSNINNGDKKWAKNPLIILDFENLPVNPGDPSDKIPLKYLVVRLTNVTEKKEIDFSFGSENDDGSKSWATLVKYTFHGDIINPYRCIEINSNFFVYKKNGKYHPAGTYLNNVDKSWISFSNNDTFNNYTKFEINIHSNFKGPYKDESGEWQNLPEDIQDDFDSERWPVEYLMVKNDNYGSARLYSGRGISNGSESLPVTTTEVFKRNLILSVDAHDGNQNDRYNFKDVLWSSLNSPRHFEIFPVGVNINSYGSRYIQNFVDIDENDGDCRGGGYPGARNGLETDLDSHQYYNSIHLARITDKPYYSSSENNNNTGEWQPNKPVVQYASIEQYSSKSDDNVWDEIPKNRFSVKFKLLYKPENDEDVFSIQYTFGQQSNSKVTFARYNNMDGTATPYGKSHINANRKVESITLQWNKDSFDVNQNFTYPMKSILLFDVASGKSSHNAVLSNTVAPYNNLIIKKYNIIVNIFQLKILNINDNGSIEDIPVGSGVPYTAKIFNTDKNASTIGHQYKYTSSLNNYTPFRYINTLQDKRLIFSTKNNNPLLKKITEKYLFLPSKQYLSTRNADIIKNSTSNNLTEDILSFPRETNGNTFQITPYTGETKNTGDIIVFSSPKFGPDSNISTFKNQKNLEIVKLGSGQFRQYPAPFMTRIDNSFISDYWQWNDEISFNAIKLDITDETLNTIKTIINNHGKNENDEITMDRTTFNNLLSGNYTLDEINKYFNLLKNDDDVITLTRVEDEVNIRTWKYFINQSKIATTANLYNIYYESENGDQIKYILANTYNKIFDISYMDSFGNKVYNPQFRVLGTKSIQEPLEDRPIILSITGGGVSLFNSGIFYIGNDGSVDPSRGLNKEIVEWTFKDIFNSKKDEIQNTTRYNSTYNIFILGANLIAQNSSFSGVRCLPYPIILNVVEISNIEQFWPRVDSNGDPIKSYKEMVSNDSKGVEIQWNYLDNVDKTEGNIYWIIKKKNLVTLEETIINHEKGGLSVKKKYNDNGEVSNEYIEMKSENLLQTLSINYDNNTYKFIDREMLVYDKYQYTIEGIFKWDTLLFNNVRVSNPLSINIEGFQTEPIFVCRNNQFEFGRFNTTSTNLKLFKPLNNLQNCTKVNYNITRKIGSSNNIYHNTTNQMTKKQIFNYLSISKFRPFR